MVRKEASGLSTISSTTRKWREYCSLHVEQQGRKHILSRKIFSEVLQYYLEAEDHNLLKPHICLVIMKSPVLIQENVGTE